jgi:adenylylsulfate kinase-like enzyme
LLPAESSTKGLAGEIKSFTGVNDPYEPPLAPDVVVESDRELVELSTGKIINGLEKRELIPGAARIASASAV